MSFNYFCPPNPQPQPQQQLIRAKIQRRQTQEKGSVKQGQSSHGASFLSKHRSQNSSRLNLQKQSVSPSRSLLTNQEHFKQMQTVILSENNNLKQHNVFLKKQIATMFARQKQQKRELLMFKQKVNELQSINHCLQKHIHTLISNVVQEISRMQAIINQERNNLLSRISEPSSHKLSSVDASETQSTIHRDLEDLKGKVKQIYGALENTPSKEHLKIDKSLKFTPITPSLQQDYNLEKYIPKQNSIKQPQEYYAQGPSTIVKQRKNQSQRAFHNHFKPK